MINRTVILIFAFLLMGVAVFILFFLNDSPDISAPVVRLDVSSQSSPSVYDDSSIESSFSHGKSLVSPELAAKEVESEVKPPVLTPLPDFSSEDEVFFLPDLEGGVDSDISELDNDLGKALFDDKGHYRANSLPDIVNVSKSNNVSHDVDVNDTHINKNIDDKSVVGDINYSAYSAAHDRDNVKNIDKDKEHLWEIRGAKRGTAIIFDNVSKETVTIEVGDYIDGIGKIISIQRNADGWVVVGSNKTIKQ